MYKLLLPICLVLTSFSLKAQYLNFNKLILENEEYHLTVPFEYQKGKIYLPVTIHGNEYRFCFDTGCPSMISESILKTVECKELKSILLRDVNHKVDTARNVLLPNLKISELNFKDIPVPILPESFIECDDFKGIIGANMFRNSIVFISFRNKTITITNDRKKIKVKNKYRYLMRLPENRSTPIVISEVVNAKNKRKAEFIFDTGDNALLTLSPKFIKSFTERKILQFVDSTYGKGSYGVFGVPKDTVQKIYKVPELKVNKAKIKNVYTREGKIASIGCELIEYGDVLLDFQNRSFGFIPYQEVCSSRQVQLPIDITFNKDRLEVSRIWDENLKDIKVGDRVIEIDGVNVENVDNCDLVQKNFLYLKSHAVLLVENEQGERKVFELHRLY